MAHRIPEVGSLASVEGTLVVVGNLSVVDILVVAGTLVVVEGIPAVAERILVVAGILGVKGNSVVVLDFVDSIGERTASDHFVELKETDRSNITVLNIHAGHHIM